MQIDDLSVKKIDKILLNENYVPDNEISTTLYLSFLLGKPMLIEGPPGVSSGFNVMKVSLLNRLLENGIIKNNYYTLKQPKTNLTMKKKYFMKNSLLGVLY